MWVCTASAVSVTWQTGFAELEPLPSAGLGRGSLILRRGYPFWIQVLERGVVRQSLAME